ncbi:Protein fem-1-like protein C [Armadillidium nasatum]|uniref:Protein fem-1-like protein C n=1 Tax=Armadillidium nasatum TaxID=96803 RepID=A0A5N5SZD2_9CRUS|nr:Protein fem-1-like protein C [Armadillidium nasatum]
MKAFLDRRSRSEVDLLVNSRTNGATPLVVASKNGHIYCVEYLVDHCSSDLEQVGSVVFDGETIDGAPPLWCAAAAGHLSVVSFLVSRGADVNATTKTNSTPLRAACFDGHFEIVEFLVKNSADIEVANRHGHTCLMIACYKGHYVIADFLIKIKANVNRKSVKGNTALHDCAESGSLNIMKLLLDNGAKMDVDSYGMTPLLAAAVTGHTHIVEYLISRDDLVTRKDKIDALELLGATYVDKKRDMLGALKFWKLAMMERYEDGKMIFRKPKQLSPVSAYENAVEVETLHQLDEIISDPDEMRMQALLVRERILGPAHPDTSYYIRYRGAVYADTGNFSRCITLWMYALEMQQKILEPLSPMTQSSFVSFAELFSFMMKEAHNKSIPVPPVNFCDIMRVFQKCLREIEVGMGHLNKFSCMSTKNTSTSNTSNTSLKSRSNTSNNAITNSTSNSSNNYSNGERDTTYFHRTLVITLHLICLINKMVGSLSKIQSHTLRCAVHRFIRLSPTGTSGVSPLHLACSRDTESSVGRFAICMFPNLDVVSLLLECGADPNARDIVGNTPLHTLANNKQCRRDIAQCLLDGGSHLDSLNRDKQTFESTRSSKGQPIHQIINPLHYTSLQCLSAKVIQNYKIPYSNLPPLLSKFVSQH